MQRSESIKALAKALVLAKSKMEAPTKDKTNPHFKSKYADLASVKSSYQPALTEAGLSVVHALAFKEALTLTTTVLHADSAEWIASDFPIPAGLKAQEIGSALTYGRRYNVCALLDIVAEDDDDGNAASGPQKAQDKKPENKEPKPSALTHDERLKLTALAKSRGILTAPAFSEFLAKHCPDARTPSELSRSELAAVTDILNGMPAVEVKKGAAA
jgi:hypothetical protein